MASINDLPMDLMIHLLDYVSNDDFYRMSNVSRCWLRACQLRKFPLEKVSFDTNYCQNNQVVLNINGRYYNSFMTYIVFEQIDAMHAKAEIYQQGRRTSHEFKSLHSAPGDYMLLALEQFLKLLKEYRVDSVEFNMFNRPELVSLLTERILSFRYKCQSLTVYEAAHEQIDILSRAFQADNYTLGLSSDLLPQPLPMNKNIMRCPGSLITQRLIASNEISLLKCQHLEIEADSSIDISILEKWGQEFLDGVAGCERLVRLNRIKASYEEVEELVKRHAHTSISRFENRSPDGGAPVILLSCLFENSTGFATLSFVDNCQADGYYSVKFGAYNRHLF